ERPRRVCAISRPRRGRQRNPRAADGSVGSDQKKSIAGGLRRQPLPRERRCGGLRGRADGTGPPFGKGEHRVLVLGIGSISRILARPIRLFRRNLGGERLLQKIDTGSLSDTGRARSTGGSCPREERRKVADRPRLFGLSFSDDP